MTEGTRKLGYGDVSQFVEEKLCYVFPASKEERLTREKDDHSVARGGSVSLNDFWFALASCRSVQRQELICFRRATNDDKQEVNKTDRLREMISSILSFPSCKYDDVIIAVLPLNLGQAE